MNRKHPGIDRIEGPHDSPVAWTAVGKPHPFRLSPGHLLVGGTTNGNYNVALQYAVPIEPYAEAVLRPEHDVFV